MKCDFKQHLGCGGRAEVALSGCFLVSVVVVVAVVELWKVYNVFGGTLNPAQPNPTYVNSRLRGTNLLFVYDY